MNKVILIGRLTKDVELRRTSTGLAVAKFSLAVQNIYSKDKGADFFNCVAWGKSAENLERYCGKGSQIAVDGALTNGSYEKDGKKTYYTEINVNSVEFLSSNQEKKETIQEKDTSFGEFNINDLDIPF